MAATQAGYGYSRRSTSGSNLNSSLTNSDSFVTGATYSRVARTSSKGSINSNNGVNYKKADHHCTKCINYSILLCSLAIFLFGVILLAVGVWAHTHYSATKLVSFQDPILISVIVLGSLVTLTSLLGCCGAWTNARVILVLFAFFLGLLVLAQLSLGVGSAVISNKVPSEADKIWDDIDNITKEWTQKNWQCCGFLNITDNPILPCPNVTNITACYPALKQTLALLVETVEIGSFVIGSIEGTVVIITIVLICIVTRSKNEPEYIRLTTTNKV